MAKDKKKNETPVAIDEANGEVLSEETMEAQEMAGEPSIPPIGPTTTNGLTAAEFEAVKVRVDEICPDPLNPNEETPETFNTLTSTISEDGFDQPIVICPIADNERHELGAEPQHKYVIAKGEHRWRAARVLGHQTVPAVIRDWDKLTRRTRLVRDNVVRGDVNKKKFTELVNSMQQEHRMDAELTSSLLGFDTSKEMFSLMEKEGKKKGLEDDAHVDRAKDNLRVLDDLSLVLNTLFTKHGHTLPYGYIAFMWGGKLSVMVEMEDALKAQMERVMALSAERKVDISLILQAILNEHFGEPESK